MIASHEMRLSSEGIMTEPDETVAKAVLAAFKEKDLVDTPQR